MTAPTSEELYMLELINEARLDPLASAERYISSYSTLSSSQPNIQNALDFFGVSGDALLDAFSALEPVGPLAWNSKLASAAEKHSAQMIAADEQSHQVDGELSLGQRITAEGYDWWTVGENVYAYSQDLLYGHAGFMVDWGYDDVDYQSGSIRSDFAQVGDGMQDAAGHRVNIMNPNFREVGIDVTYETLSSTEVGPMVVTQDFASSDVFYITGIAYDDNNGDNFYSVGEGRAGVSVKVGSGGVVTGEAGSYDKAVYAGQYNIEISGSGVSGNVNAQATISDENLKLDIVDGNTLVTSGSITVDGDISEIRGIGSNNLKLVGNFGNETILGSDGNDTLEGKDGADVLGGGKGNDILRGGVGIDVAVFEGNSSQFSFSSSGNNKFVVSGNGQGSDTTFDVEVFRFNDGDFIYSIPDDALVQFSEASNSGAPDNSLDAVSDYNSQSVSYVTGHAYTDNNNNGSYNSGEGKANLSVKIGSGTEITGSDGAFDRSVFSGPIEVTLSGAGLSKKVVVETFLNQDTIELDVVNGDTLVTSGSIVVDGRIYEIRGTGNQGLQLTGDENNQTIIGTSGGDLLDGANGSDVLIGGLGSDKLIGGNGIDIAVFNGNFDQFTFTNVNGATVVSGNGQGSDSTWGVELFRFNDGDYYYSSSTGAVPFGHEGSAGSGGGSGGGGSGGGGSSSVNEDPEVPGSQLATTVEGTPVILKINASDPDGDALSFSANGFSDGVVSGGTGGVFIYTPHAGFIGRDDFAVTVTDGNGGSAVMTVTVDVDEAGPGGASNSAPTMALIGMDGFAGAIGGNGKVFGSNGFQSITLQDQPDTLNFDASFNGGGDIIKFPNDAALYSIELEGSSVIIRDNDSSYSIPIGPVGLALQFADGIRTLGFDEAAQAVKVGSQTVSGSPVAILAGTDGSNAPTGEDPDAVASITQTAGSEVTVGGNYSVFGTSDGDEIVHYLRGDIDLDSSFNRGGDELDLPGQLSDYSAYIDGSDLIIVSDLGKISIPLGLEGVTLNVDGGEHQVTINADTQGVFVGDQEIVSNDMNEPQQLGGGSGGGSGGSENSLDSGQPTSYTQIELDDGAFTLTDDANVNSYVEIFNFNEDDQIVVSGANSGDYSFGTAGNDIEINFNDGSSTNSILIKDIYTGGLVFDEGTAENALGWDFITFA